jgi:hypothetical protein
VQDERPHAGDAACEPNWRAPHAGMIPQSGRAAKRSHAECVQRPHIIVVSGDS